MWIMAVPLNWAWFPCGSWCPSQRQGPSGCGASQGVDHAPLGVKAPLGVRTPLSIRALLGIRSPLGVCAPLGIRPLWALGPLWVCGPSGVWAPLGMWTPLGLVSAPYSECTILIQRMHYILIATALYRPDQYHGPLGRIGDVQNPTNRIPTVYKIVLQFCSIYNNKLKRQSSQNLPNRIIYSHILTASLGLE